MINDRTASRQGEKLEKNPAPSAPNIVIVLTPPFVVGFPARHPSIALRIFGSTSLVPSSFVEPQTITAGTILNPASVNSLYPAGVYTSTSTTEML
ncbi:MAG: hypothetical protein AMQ74_01491 [Candidatus Methanofastidiosum methylothiophilum]|uniref:Uncharacterized protein n=1 Tax=Candidatus Methanofastidiosum methylothiophilum TaxID=1705564 RepID=A0A150IVP4_9EURY|nr:MAG: hypothetical protein AMQ74_01491 [Candidatus Methanofastidiosum methylthiophilus]